MQYEKIRESPIGAIFLNQIIRKTQKDISLHILHQNMIAFTNFSPV
jgi:hypothetical protein